MKCSTVKNKGYNSGNVDFELLIKENSTVDVYDKFEDDQEATNAEVTTIPDALMKVGSMMSKFACFWCFEMNNLQLIIFQSFVEINAMVKTVPAVFKNKDHNLTIGSITDGFYQLEIKLNYDCGTLKVQKGSSVEVTGFLEQFPPGPPVLRIDCKEQFRVLNKARLPFLDLIKGFKTKPLQC